MGVEEIVVTGEEWRVGVCVGPIQIKSTGQELLLSVERTGGPGKTYRRIYEGIVGLKEVIIRRVR